MQIFLQQICPTEPIPRDRLNQILIQAHEVKAGCLGSWGPKLALRKFLKHSAFCVVNDILYKLYKIYIYIYYMNISIICIHTVHIYIYTYQCLAIDSISFPPFGKVSFMWCSTIAFQWCIQQWWRLGGLGTFLHHSWPTWRGGCVFQREEPPNNGLLDPFIESVYCVDSVIPMWCSQSTCKHLKKKTSFRNCCSNFDQVAKNPSDWFSSHTLGCPPFQ